MACVGRSVKLSVDKEDAALGKEKVISVIIVKGQDTFFGEKKNGAISF